MEQAQQSSMKYPLEASYVCPGENDSNLDVYWAL